MDENYVTRDEFNKLDEKVDVLQIEQTRTKQRVEHVERKLDKIETNTTWILRLILGAIIAMVLGLLFQAPEATITLGGI
ncbi:hemolysin XhlA family protein [Halobacillus litoralis]|uniref:hemolysin XhlA family protein n=1 Tax=Halobacillus litoralis TaxID=45668 RepID=UPI001CD35F1E|nr:hemolysin XhlA family protein [Halobacillus litoralis]MCA1021769.1 hemolysin XhlA family protein [Halobacillus litoralis]